MKQKEIKSIPALLGSAGTIKAAAAAKGAGIPLLHNTAVNIGMDADALTTACTNQDEGKVVLANYRAVLATIVFTVRAFLTLGRDILKPLFGSFYSQSYDVLGFTNSSIAIPRTVEELLVMLIKFKAYFTAHPEQEDESRNITAARCQELYDQLVAANANVNLQNDALEALTGARDQAAETMRNRIRNLIGELSTTLSPLDSRWLAFGFNMPGAQETPDNVEGLIATLVGAGKVFLKWNASARAEYYRVYMKVHGTTDEYVLLDSRAELDFTIENLTVNTTVDFVVTAVNNGGESSLTLSEPVTIAIPA